MILIDVILIQQKDEKQYINKILCNQWHRRFHTLAGVFLLDRFGYGSCVGQDTINLVRKHLATSRIFTTCMAYHLNAPSYRSVASAKCYPLGSAAGSAGKRFRISGLYPQYTPFIIRLSFLLTSWDI